MSEDLRNAAGGRQRKLHGKCLVRVIEEDTDDITVWPVRALADEFRTETGRMRGKEGGALRVRNRCSSAVRAGERIKR